MYYYENRMYYCDIILGDGGWVLEVGEKEGFQVSGFFLHNSEFTNSKFKDPKSRLKVPIPTSLNHNPYGLTPSNHFILLPILQRADSKFFLECF
jgi:hypothetical protein